MTVSRDRKEAAKALGIALQVRYRKLLMANGEDEITVAAVDLGKCFNDNIEFAIWALRTFGGDTVQPPERVNARPTLIGVDYGKPGGDHTVEVTMQDGKVLGSCELPQMPALLSAGADIPLRKKH